VPRTVDELQLMRGSASSRRLWPSMISVVCAKMLLNLYCLKRTGIDKTICCYLAAEEIERTGVYGSERLQKDRNPRSGIVGVSMAFAGRNLGLQI